MELICVKTIVTQGYNCESLAELTGLLNVN